MTDEELIKWLRNLHPTDYELRHGILQTKAADHIEQLNAKLAKAVKLIELAVELARFDLNPKLCDDMIDFVTDLELEKPE